MGFWYVLFYILSKDLQDCHLQETFEWESLKTVLGAYLKRNDHNIVALDWTNMNKGNYVINVLPNVPKVGILFL